jgi:hypothetical protein
MRVAHILALAFHALIALPFFTFMWTQTGDGFCAFMAGWSIAFGAISTRALRKKWEGVKV